ncbi:MAG: exosortase/archaeosortase family protein [Fibrella sp.]|nr:exosortase/archaeosortase family protein [Armatimonadota bacterium]
MNTAYDVASSPDSPAPVGWWARQSGNSISTGRDIIALFKRSPEWIIIIFAWLAAAFIPAFWYMGEDHWWSQPSSPLFFEPFVPLFSAALLWQDRNRLLEAWQMTPRNKRRGSPWLLYLGCLLVMVSHLIHVLTVAAIGLVVVAAGVIYLAYGPFVLKQSGRALAFALLFAPPPVKPVSMIAHWFSNSAWTKITAALQRLGQDASCTTGADSTTLVIQGHVIAAPNSQLTAIVITGFLLLFSGVWRRDRIGTVLLTMAFGSLLAGFLSMIIPFAALLLPPSGLSDVLVQVHPLVLVAISVFLGILVRNRLARWLQTLSERSRIIGKMYSGVQKFTDRATAGVVTRAGSGRSGQRVTKGTEAMMDKFFAAISKPFKRKRRNRW